MFTRSSADWRLRVSITAKAFIYGRQQCDELVLESIGHRLSFRSMQSSQVRLRRFAGRCSRSAIPDCGAATKMGAGR